MTRPHLLLMLMINLLWGLNFVAVKWTLADFPPLLSALGRFLLVFLICLPWLKPRPGRMRPLLAVAGLGTLHFTLMFIALGLAESASAMAIIGQMGVPFATVMAVLFLGERIGWRRTLGIAMAFAGVVIIKYEPGGAAAAPVLAMLGSSLVYAVATIGMRRLAGVKPLELQAWTGAVSLIPLAALSLALEGDPRPYLASAGLYAWVGVVYSAVASSVIAHAANFYLLQRYPVTIVAPFTLLVPLIAVAAGVIILGDVLSWGLVVGGLLSLSGVAVITLRALARARAQP
ncbi:MAG: DMT family transporter [Pseudomonadota bacterium]